MGTVHITPLLKIRIRIRSDQGWKKPGFFLKNPAQWVFMGFLGFFWVFFVFFGFFGFFGFFWVFLGFFAWTRGFLGFFSVSRILLGASRL
jgi:hypothetical protein